jgi:hypothetical protein
MTLSLIANPNLDIKGVRLRDLRRTRQKIANRMKGEIISTATKSLKCNICCQFSWRNRFPILESKQAILRGCPCFEDLQFSRKGSIREQSPTVRTPLEPLVVFLMTMLVITTIM